MRTKYLCVLIHIRRNGEVGAVTVQALNLFGLLTVSSSFVNPFFFHLYCVFVFAMLSCLFLAVL